MFIASLYADATIGALFIILLQQYSYFDNLFSDFDIFE